MVGPLDADTMTVELIRTEGSPLEFWGIPMRSVPRHLRAKHSSFLVSATDEGQFLGIKEIDKRVVVQG